MIVRYLLLKLPHVVVCFLLFIISSFNAMFANIRLPNIIGDHMVLQQNSEVNLWGWAAPSEKIAITTSWDNRVDSIVTDGNAKWKVKIKTPRAGGPYTITLKGDNTITLKDIMMGEVWLCSGQSNMEWSSQQKLQQMIDEIPKSSNSNIRLFQVPKSTAEFPQDNLEGQWKLCGPESVNGFSAIAYFFAKQLQQKLNIPVAVINSSWGGTPAEVWTPEAAAANNEALVQLTKKQNAEPRWPLSLGAAYNAMIDPLTNFSIAGVIWYQGESNTGRYFEYNNLFTTMINSWRTAWNKEFPFYYVQIAPFAYAKKNIGNLLREQQTKTLALPKTGMVVVTDLVDNVKDIHPKNKIDVALRLANYALAEVYKQNAGVYKSPMLKKMEIEKGKANLYFDYAPNGFKLSSGKTATEFYIAGADQQFIPAKVTIEKNRLSVSSSKVANPVAVRFSFSNEGMSNIFSKEGLPIAPFRTDDWRVDTSKVK